MGCIREECIWIGEDIKGYGWVLLGSGWLDLVRRWLVGFGKDMGGWVC